jgi:hypothetical protein
MEMQERFYGNLDKILVDVKSGDLEKMLQWMKEFGLTTFAAISGFLTSIISSLKDIASKGLDTISGVIPVDQIPKGIATFFQNAYASLMQVLSNVVSHLTGAAKAIATNVPATVTVGAVTISTAHLILGGVAASVVLLALFKLFNNLKAQPSENTFSDAMDIFNEMPLFAESISKHLSEENGEPSKMGKVISTILNKGKQIADKVVDMLSSGVDKLEGAAKVLLSSKAVRILLGVCVLLISVGFMLLFSDQVQNLTAV